MKYTEKDIDKMSEEETDELFEDLLRKKMTYAEFAGFVCRWWDEETKKDTLKDYIDTLNS